MKLFPSQGFACAALLFALVAVAAGSAPATDMPLTGNALLRTWAPPVYPPEALKQRAGGLTMIRMIVDEKGHVASAHVLDSMDPRFDAAALAAVKKWVFSPALDEGRPVAMSMDVPVQFSPDEEEQGKRPGFLPPANQTPTPSPRTPAAPSETYNAEYPESLIDRKLSGIVRFTATIGADGQASKVRIIVASHPDFVIPALRSLDRWTFRPGMQGDLPIETDIRGDITFESTVRVPAEVLEANHITAPDGSPPPAAPELRAFADPVWPYELLMGGEGGSASVTYTVDKEGHVQDAQIQSATKPEFGKALLAAAEANVFISAAEAGHSIAVPVMQRADFAAITPGAVDDSNPIVRLMAAVRAKQVVDSQVLDERLTPVFRIAPVYPGVLRKNGRPAGHAVIDFVIDREGRARLPHIVSATNEEFGWAAATAVSLWVFKAPISKGQPVDVRARIPFDFKAPAK